jgi:hypothetical protein
LRLVALVWIGRSVARPTRAEAARNKLAALEAELEIARREVLLEVMRDPDESGAVRVQAVDRSGKLDAPDDSQVLVPGAPAPDASSNVRPSQEQVVAALKTHVALVPGTEHLTVREYIDGTWASQSAKEFLLARQRADRVEREAHRARVLYGEARRALDELDLVARFSEFLRLEGVELRELVSGVRFEGQQIGTRIATIMHEVELPEPHIALPSTSEAADGDNAAPAASSDGG